MFTRADRCPSATAPVRCLLLLLAFVLLSTPASAASEETYCEVLPPAPWVERVVPVHGIAAGAPEDGEEVTYLSWDGEQHRLRRLRGRHVDLLLPPPWMEGLSGEQRLRLVRLLDYAWSAFSSLTGREPLGGSRAPFAVLEGWKKSNLAHARVGLKGSEYSSALLTQTIRGLEANALEGVWAHEMAHNFDVFSGYLFHAHAWTSFTDVFFTRLYLQQMTTLHQYSAVTELPEEALLEQGERFRREYVANPARSWQTDIAPAETPSTSDHYAPYNVLWGRVVLEFARLHGREAIHRWMSIVRRQALGTPPPETAEARADFLFETLAEAAGANTECYADRWRWYASAGVRSRMTSKYGAQNVQCTDDDGDGMSELDGDCDDDSRFVRSCSGRPHRAMTLEGDGDFRGPEPVAAPATIRGQIVERDVDEFALQALAGDAYLQLAADPQFGGEAVVTAADGDVVLRTGADHGPATPMKHFLGQGSYTLRLSGGSRAGTGPYRLEIASVADLLLHRWSQLTVVRCDDSLRFEVEAAAQRGGTLKVWVDRVGFVPDADDRVDAVTWRPQAAGVYSASAVLVDDRGIPVTALTEPLTFDSAAATASCSERRRALRR